MYVCLVCICVRNMYSFVYILAHFHAHIFVCIVFEQVSGVVCVLVLRAVCVSVCGRKRDSWFLILRAIHPLLNSLFTCTFC